MDTLSRVLVQAASSTKQFIEYHLYESEPASLLPHGSAKIFACYLVTIIADGRRNKKIPIKVCLRKSFHSVWPSYATKFTTALQWPILRKTPLWEVWIRRYVSKYQFSMHIHFFSYSTSIAYKVYSAYSKSWGVSPLFIPWCSESVLEWAAGLSVTWCSVLSCNVSHSESNILTGPMASEELLLSGEIGQFT